MNKKILFTASTQSHLDNFHQPYIKAFEDMEYEVIQFVPPVSKNMLSLQNLRAIGITRKLLRNGDFDVVSSQSTLAGIVTRLAMLSIGNSGRNTKVFHTSHGYLFNDDNSIMKWIYILPEKICAAVTDVLMVMNMDDLAIAHKYKLCRKSDNIHFIDGMGVNFNKFKPVQQTHELKQSFGINENDFVFVYVGEFSKRKNHELLLKGFAQTIKNLPISTSNSIHRNSLKLVFAGDGALLNEMKSLAKELGISNNILFLGYTKNIQELYASSDVAVTTSRIEGLPFNVMEAMACGLPVLASNIKGHKDLITDGVNGLLFESENQNDLSNKMIEMYQNSILREDFKTSSSEKIKKFSIENVLPTVMSIYRKNI